MAAPVDRVYMYLRVIKGYMYSRVQVALVLDADAAPVDRVSHAGIILGVCYAFMYQGSDGDGVFGDSQN